MLAEAPEYLAPEDLLAVDRGCLEARLATPHRIAASTSSSAAHRQTSPSAAGATRLKLGRLGEVLTESMSEGMIEFQVIYITNASSSEDAA
ncbi:hypothetical protein DBR42_05075 [Pelomonas sp. HMWF004]|nr:hypothetical protein DBR42_05075 [Pelomonas sp. HMWF004]